MIIPVVMAGGSGTRLWPLSRTLFPKQFLPLHGELTMLQATLRRLEGLPVMAPITICNEEHRFIVAEQLRLSPEPGSILLEPVGRNTAPAIALAALQAVQQSGDGLLLVLAADHVINDESAFRLAVENAIDVALQDKLVTFGIVPTSAHSGYGYIRKGDPLESDTESFVVDAFVEKPSVEKAEQYLASGDYFWNSGMFLFKASHYLQELETFRPDILKACQLAMADVSDDLDFTRINAEAFSACPDESIDYAVMEKTDVAVVVPMDAGWNDVGSWSSLWDIGDKNDQDNVVCGDVVSQDTHGCLIHGEDRLVTTLGVNDLVIVDTPDALLVADKGRVQDIKGIVAELKAGGRDEVDSHRAVYRPWGRYDSIDQGDRYQVKHITVKPGGKLSVQMHHHRAEHWVVVSGTARVTNGDKQVLLSENESTYIPIGVVHALENPGIIPLELIEVQSGAYLGEDDIIRFEDCYGRTD